jgi:hypothetical protein
MAIVEMVDILGMEWIRVSVIFHLLPKLDLLESD